ncbi:unnamed protein product, partial [Amoebophrya sp. A25]
YRHTLGHGASTAEYDHYLRWVTALNFPVLNHDKRELYIYLGIEEDATLLDSCFRG